MQTVLTKLSNYPANSFACKTKFTLNGRIYPSQTGLSSL